MGGSNGGGDLRHRRLELLRGAELCRAEAHVAAVCAQRRQARPHRTESNIPPGEITLYYLTEGLVMAPPLSDFAPSIQDCNVPVRLAVLRRRSIGY